MFWQNKQWNIPAKQMRFPLCELAPRILSFKSFYLNISHSSGNELREFYSFQERFRKMSLHCFLQRSGVKIAAYCSCYLEFSLKIALLAGLIVVVDCICSSILSGLVYHRPTAVGGISCRQDWLGCYCQLRFQEFVVQYFTFTVINSIQSKLSPGGREQIPPPPPPPLHNFRSFNPNLTETSSNWSLAHALSFGGSVLYVNVMTSLWRHQTVVLKMFTNCFVVTRYSRWIHS